MLGVFALWCVPYLRQASTIGAGGVWARQMEQRVGLGNRATILANLARSVVNFLPWALALPLFWREGTLARLAARDRLIVEGGRWPMVICAFALMLIPGMLPRYTLPLVIPYALLLAALLKGQAGERAGEVLRWPLAAACVAGVAGLAYGAFFARRVAAYGGAREFAARVNAAMPAGADLYLFEPGVQPEVFYLRGRILYTDSVKTLPDEVPWLLAPENAVKRLRGRFRKSEILAEAREESGRGCVLISLHGHAGRGQGK